MEEIEIENNEENFVKECLTELKDLSKLSPKHTDYYEFLEKFNKAVSKIESNN